MTSPYSVIAKMKHGGEALLSMGYTPNEALRAARANEIDLYPDAHECLLLQQWIPLYMGGYWKCVGKFRPKLERKVKAFDELAA